MESALIEVAVKDLRVVTSTFQLFEHIGKEFDDNGIFFILACDAN